MPKPLIAITMGDPAGVGPELCMRALGNAAVLEQCIPLVFGDAGIMKRVTEFNRLRSDYVVVSWKDWKKNPVANKPMVVDLSAFKAKKLEVGIISAACGKASAEYVKAAVEAASGGWVSGIVTAPIHKTAWKMAGVPFSGHTELLASLCKTRKFCMMMASVELKVSLVTTHVGISKVSGLITKDRILEVVELTNSMLKKLGRKNPRIAVLSLNPHVGEEGTFGREEGLVIRPAIALAMEKGMNIEGPLPPDSAFLLEKRKKIDAYIAMYHDQGLIPFKMLAFEEGVNITLGLPIVRTSVDHGTAFDIAWTARASVSSMVQAVLWAIKLAGKE